MRAFISNPLFPSGTAGAFGAVLNIVDASLDQLSFSYVNLTGASAHPGLMALSPNKKLMMVFSSSDDSIVVVNALSETQASNADRIVGDFQRHPPGPDREHADWHR